MENKQKVLLICTGYSYRSQIAEGLLNKMTAKYFDVYSAGNHPSRVNSDEISIMKEIDISNSTSNPINEYLKTGIDIVISVCDNAKRSCPVFPKDTMKIHWSIDDPFQGWDENEKNLNSFRKTRIELKGRMQELINEMELS